MAKPSLSEPAIMPNTLLPLAAVLLDLDGTLVDSIPDLAHAANAMRVELKLSPLPQDVITSFVGKGVERLVGRALAGSLDGPAPSDAEFEAGLALFQRYYHAVNGDKTTIYDGVIPGLKTMREMGLKLAVVTNKSTQFTLPLLARTGLAGFFDAVVCGDTCARKKPDPMPMLHACALLGVKPAEALVIGDSINDAQSGRSAGTRVLLVPYGYNEGHDVRTLEVDGIVSSLVEAAGWIESQTP
jgi:phosphoglycolate phosphatase